MRLVKKALPVLALAVALGLLLAGCDDRRDTRKYIHTIGVVITLDVDATFQELYVYPGGIEEMGQDFIKNTKELTRVGSFGVTVEQSNSYGVWLKDREGGAYEFERVAFQNGDMAVITFKDKLLMTVHHQDGETETVNGSFVPPGDAPDHSQVPLKEEDNFRFGLVNSTGVTINAVSMREADAPEKGEVELRLDPLKPDKTATISGRLDEDDFEKDAWLLEITDADGKIWTSKDSFDPWTSEKITVSLEDGKLVLEVESA
ncbi:hypothetical protein LJC60_01935 [Ruminococcaceae bacterium OttesenSCG-928-D13]|nr:hypothetical protein [Ruminococcaceae bacterium OttesenSCG-928-D13]